MLLGEERFLSVDYAKYLKRCAENNGLPWRKERRVLKFFGGRREES